MTKADTQKLLLALEAWPGGFQTILTKTPLSQIQNWSRAQVRARFEVGRQSSWYFSQAPLWKWGNWIPERRPGHLKRVSYSWNYCPLGSPPGAWRYHLPLSDWLWEDLTLITIRFIFRAGPAVTLQSWRSRLVVTQLRGKMGGLGSPMSHPKVLSPLRKKIKGLMEEGKT